jgi:LPS export ABC transporter protein LptC
MYKSATYGIIMAAVLLCGAAVFSSCENKPEVIKDLVIQNLPELTEHNLETIYTDSGKIQVILRSPILERYTDEQKNARNEFTKGINVVFFKGKPDPQASITSKYAVYTEKDKLWELRDSVVVVNESGSMLQTELLYWNEAKDRVWTDRFVKYTTKDQILMGTGFESDSRLDRVRGIKNATGTLYIKNE